MTVFYRKYRPQKFDDLVGQVKIKSTLLSQLELGKISHGYLFAGPRGTGKTSTARIFAKALNCQIYSKGDRWGEPCGECESCVAVSNGSHLDLFEIDAASNRGIDEIRDLREKIKLSPISSKFKIYIIDEAHMLTNEAFNALLKTLEEPPAHAIFILCTTEVNKLPATIISRLSRFNFSRATEEDVASALGKIAKIEKIDFEDGVFLHIANIADGSFRDAVSLLDQLSSEGKKIKIADVSKVGGTSGFSLIKVFLEALAQEDLKSSILIVEKAVDDGVDVSYLIKETIVSLEKILLIKLGVFDKVDAGSDGDKSSDLEALGKKFSMHQLQFLMRQLLVAESEIKIYPLPKIPLLLAVCKVCREPEDEAGEKESAKSETVEVFKTTSDKKVSEIADDLHVAMVKEVIKEQKAELEQVEVVIHGKKGKVKSVSEIEKVWPQFLEKVRKVNVHLLALLKSTRPTAISGDILTIEAYYRFHKDKLEEPKIVKMLQGFMEELLGTRVGIVVVIAQKKGRATPAVVEQSDVEEVSSSDLSDLAQEIFSK